MKKFVLIACFLLLSALPFHAGIISLRTGATIQGQIVLNNDDVLILRDASGMKYQYPKTDILSISQDSIAAAQVSEDTTLATQSTKKSSILLNLSGGGTSIPKNTRSGGFAGVDLMIGSHNMLRRSIFLGGGLGYRVIAMPDGAKYSFLPIQFAAQIPLLDQQHTPILGASLGYGVALTKEVKGGLYSSFNAGYCYRINRRTKLAISANVQLQQVHIQTTEYITNQEVVYPFQHTAGRCLVFYGINLSFFL